MNYKLVTNQVTLRGLRFHAYHGVLEQERKTGGDFLVSLRVGFPIEKAMCSDDVSDTLNYAALYEMVKKEIDK